MYNAENYRVRGSAQRVPFSPAARIVVQQAPARAVVPPRRVVQTQVPQRIPVQASRRAQVVAASRRPVTKLPDQPRLVREGNNGKPNDKKGSKEKSPSPSSSTVPPGCSSLKGNVPDPQHAGKILICHVPNNGNPETYSINASALAGHDGHCQDYDGPCASNPPHSPPHSPPGECTFGAPDCKGICNGPNVQDCSGFCYDPSKEVPRATLDCKGVCGGKSELDCAMNCYDPTKEPPPKTRDCSGTCGGTKVPDCKGVCGGSAVKDCKGVCGGNAVVDCKGVCGGNAILDCAGVCFCPDSESPKNTRDCNGKCNGNSYRDCSGKCISDECKWDGKPYAHTANATAYVQNSRRTRFAPKNE